MKKFHRSVGITFFILFLLSQTTIAQQRAWNVDLSSGLSIPKSFSGADTSLFKAGPQFQAGLNYLGKRVGLEIKGGYFTQPLHEQVFSAFEALPAASDLRFTRDFRRSIFGAIGPVVHLGTQKLAWQIAPKVGWLSSIAPALNRRSKAAAEDNPLLLQADESGGRQSYWSVGTKLEWQLSKRLGLHVAADYLSMPGGEDQQFNRLSDQLQAAAGPKGGRELEAMALQIARQQGNILNLGAGITYHFGSSGSEAEKSQITCENAYLLTPATGSVFLIQGTLRPAFHWQNATETAVRYYLFRLYAGDQLLYEQQTEGNSIEHNKDLEALYRKSDAEEQNYSWEVITYFTDCEPLDSGRSFFKMSNRSGAFHDIFDLACDEPAYAANGDQQLTGKISFFNNISSSDPLIINDFNDVIIQDVLGNPLPGVSLTNISDCLSGISVSIPITIPPGGTQTFCFELVVPAGNSAIRSEAHGTINGLPQLSTDQDDLPQCHCSVCDRWQFSGKTSKLTYLTSGGAFYNAQILQDLQIANAAPIREVKAEIVYVKHVANDPQCYTCTKHDNDMGLISFGNLPPKVILTNGSWKNGQNGYMGPGDTYDVNHDNFVNQVLWKAADPMNGIDFSNFSHRFRIPIKLPAPGNLGCCDHRYQVCVRYTFTDVNCATCDYLVCYQMSTKGGNGGLGSGGQSPGPKSPIHIPMPKGN